MSDQTTSFGIKVPTKASQSKSSGGYVRTLVFIVFFASFGFVARDFVPQAVVPSFATNTPFTLVNSENKDVDRTVDMNLFWEALQLIQDNYLDAGKVSGTDLVNGAISGMVQAVGDPYTSYFTPDENISFKDSLEGLYDGIGAQLGYKDEQLAIIAPLDSSPAQEAGVRSGDLIVGVDGESTNGWSVQKAVQAIRGEAGTNVVLLLVRPSQSLDSFEITVERKTITIPAVRLSWVKDENGAETSVAHIRVMRFGSDTIETWNNVVSEAKFSGASAVVLDVRNNPGGLLSAAIYLGSDFFKDGVVVKRQTKDSVEEFTVDHTCQLCTIPVVFLIDEGSASASEILAGALQARGRAQLVGMKSFGKGTVQEAIELDGGAGIHITTARWLLPNDQNIHGEGLYPDVEISSDAASGPFTESDSREDAQLKAAFDLVK